MKTFLIAVNLRQTVAAKHWWQESKVYDWLSQHHRKAETEEIAEALALKYQLDLQRKEYPNDEWEYVNSVVWDITDKVK